MILKENNESAQSSNEIIMQQLELRNVEYLVHFTNLKNLKTIIKLGILPVSLHNVNGIIAEKNDKLRQDNLLDKTSFSIEFPNYKMLYKSKMEKPNEKWVILFINAKIILERECVFCYDNASNPDVVNIPLTERMQGQSFKKMFDDIEGTVPRSERNLKRYFPTSSQAEILIPGCINLTYIEKIVFKDTVTKEQYQNVIPNPIKCEVIPDYFYAREDYLFEK